MAHSAVVFIKPSAAFIAKIQAGGAGQPSSWATLVLDEIAPGLPTGLDRINASALFAYGEAFDRPLFLHLQNILKDKPNLPLYFVSTNPLLDEAPIRDLGFRRVFQEEDVTWELINTLVEEGIHPFEQREIIGHSKVLEAFGKKTHELRSEDLIPIRAGDFLSGSTSLFDVYVRLSTDKYIKLVHAGDIFSPARAREYIDKGVEHFYVRTSAHQSYLKYCDKLARAILNQKQLPLQLKVQQVLHLGEQVMVRVQRLGLSEESVQYAKGFLKSTTELVQSLQAPAGSMLHDFLADVAQYEHAVSTTLLSALIAQKLEIQMEKPTQIVGLSAFFHDCGLQMLPDRLRVDSHQQVAVPDLPLYDTHPELSASLFRETNQADASVIQAIVQHHQRGKTLGFNRQTNTTISKVAELIGIADEFDQLLKQYGDADREYLQQMAETSILPQFSKQIAYAFRSAIFPRKSSS